MVITVPATLRQRNLDALLEGKEKYPGLLAFITALCQRPSIEVREFRTELQGGNFTLVSLKAQIAFVA